MSLPRLAIFDLDKTFTYLDTASVWEYWMYERLHWTDSAYRRRMHDYSAQYHSGDPTYDPNAGLREHLRPTMGRRLEEVEAHMHAAAQKFVHPSFYPELVEKLQNFNAQGYTTIMLSASVEPFVRQATLYQPFAVSLGTRILVDDKGYIEGPHPEGSSMGHGKVRRLRLYLEDQDLSLEDLLPEAYFFSDSIRDEPLLSLVGHPFAANPDSHLQELAAKNHWPFKHFDHPDKNKPNPF